MPDELVSVVLNITKFGEDRLVHRQESTTGIFEPSKLGQTGSNRVIRIYTIVYKS